MGKKVLIIKFGALGDIVHTSVIASAIKTKHPDWQVDFLAGERHYKILLNHPHIDNVRVWDESDNFLHQLFSQGVRLRKENYDIVINITNALKNIVLTHFLKPKKIILRQKFDKSWVENYYLTAKSGIDDLELPSRLSLGLDENAEKEVSELIKKYPRPYFVIIPGGDTNNNRQGRIWSIKNWKKLSEALIEKYSGTVFVLGSGGEREYHSGLLQHGLVIFSGKFDLLQSSAMISKADVVISGDTGPAHIASAHGVKTLVILGSTSPDKIKPYGENGYVIEPKNDCKYCWQKRCKHLKKGEIYTPCMESIKPEDVLKMIDSEVFVGVKV